VACQWHLARRRRSSNFSPRTPLRLCSFSPPLSPGVLGVGVLFAWHSMLFQIRDYKLQSVFSPRHPGCNSPMVQPLLAATACQPPCIAGIIRGGGPVWFSDVCGLYAATLNNPSAVSPLILCRMSTMFTWRAGLTCRSRPQKYPLPAAQTSDKMGRCSPVISPGR
jgi:hypothetical protein